MGVIKCIRYSIFLSHLGIGIFGLFTQNYEMMLISVFLLWINNMVFAVENWKERFIFFWFHAMIFMFLLSRPVISVFKGYEWKLYTDEAMQFSFLSLWITMIFMLLGAIMCEEYRKTKMKRGAYVLIKETDVKRNARESFQESLQIVSLIIYIISFCAYMYLQMEKFFFMQGKIYYEFYTNFESQAPYLIHLIASFRTYSLTVFLSTAPKKRISFIVLGTFLLSDFPVLLYGKRSLILLEALFILVYYILRDGMDKKEKWIGKFEKICIFIGGPFVILVMGAMNYLRDGISVAVNVGDLFLDFLYKQGVSFKSLNLGYESIPFLPDRPFRNYTFGGIIDYFTHGNIAQQFFNAKPLGEGNNLAWALESNSFAHNMSYIAMDNYLEGHGLGSSYLLELYTDYGYIGVLLFSLLLGALMIWFVHVMRKMNFGSMIVLMIIMNFFFMPRGEATGAINFLFYMQFWAAILICYGGAALINRKYSYTSLERKGKRG